MRYLLDTHALLWWLTDDRRLSAEVIAVLGSPGHTIFVSAVSAYEVAFKHGMGKLPSAERLARAFEVEIAAEGFEGLPISLREAQMAGRMDHPHRDPFDRLLIAQSLLNDMTIISNEKLFDSFGATRLW
ncbi:twitching motility protein PilT [Brevundimonas sp. LM2]|uniref:type II toxin-antitoxin system VapC family toxin n=1 Tax=Brevundimonas sp. LM2 TaxID=1938605 RepID=UPI000983B4C1|nr:type II toxin-antitoxin system VapC family toxin [Brevundimonas sp. LM2]AQR61033.1 twitching motility protein PilT [Brevundimonas sp. LM2]